MVRVAEKKTLMKISAYVIAIIDEFRKPGDKPKTLYAKVGDGQWYAIPPEMAESFRKAGAEVRLATELPH